jgi:hypothetical protein
MAPAIVFAEIRSKDPSTKSRLIIEHLNILTLQRKYDCEVSSHRLKKQSNNKTDKVDTVKMIHR